MSNTILLVEDDPNDVLLIQRAFRKTKVNYTLQVLEDGEKAIDYLAGVGTYEDRDRYPIPVLLLLDLKLPRKSGHEVLAWLKQHQELKRLPVVVLTSSKESQDINQVYDLGANSYLVKPVAFDDLQQLVNMLNLYWLILNEKPHL